jgi:hypothetical protein
MSTVGGSLLRVGTRLAGLVRPAAASLAVAVARVNVGLAGNDGLAGYVARRHRWAGRSGDATLTDQGGTSVSRLSVPPGPA